MTDSAALFAAMNQRNHTLLPAPQSANEVPALTFLAAGIKGTRTGDFSWARETAPAAIMTSGLPEVLQAFVLRLALVTEIISGRYESARHLLRRSMGLLTVISDYEIRDMIWGGACELQYLMASDNEASAIAAQASVDLAAYPPSVLKFRRAEISYQVYAGRLLTAERMLGELPDRGGIDRNDQEWIGWDIAAGRWQAVLNRGDAVQPYPRFLACLMGGRWEEAAAILPQCTPANLPILSQVPELPQARLAAARRQWSDVDRLLPERELQVPVARMERDYVILDAALARRRIDAARIILDRIDPRRNRLQCLPQWTRWHLINADPKRAAETWAAFSAAVPQDTLRFKLDQAAELRPAQVMDLFTSAVGVAVERSAEVIKEPRDSRWQLVGSSPEMHAVRTRIAACAVADGSVLIRGETGTGKEHAAHLIHAGSARAAKPFIAVNAAALSDGLAESELFGHAKGAFTGAVSDGAGLVAAADDGVLFLDEINSLPPRLQGMLLRLIESGEYRAVGSTVVRHATCRVICASNEDLEVAVAGGRFRADLLYRIQRLEVHLPALRERISDLPELCRHILRTVPDAARRILEPSTLAHLASRPWPGNVRELANTLERMIVFGEIENRKPLSEPYVQDVVRSSAVSVAVTSAPPAPSPAAHPLAPLHTVPGPPTARRRRQRILAVFAKVPEVYPEDIHAELAAARSTIAADLQALVGAGLIERLQRSGHPRFNPYVLIRKPESRSR